MVNIARFKIYPPYSPQMPFMNQLHQITHLGAIRLTELLSPRYQILNLCKMATQAASQCLPYIRRSNRRQEAKGLLTHKSSLLVLSVC